MASNSKNIYASCKFIYQILFVMGCCGFTKQKEYFKYNRKTVLIMWLAAFWYLSSFIACVRLQFQTDEFENLHSVIKSSIYLEVALCITMYLTTVISMYLNMDKNLKLYAMIQHLDEKLLKEFSYRFNYGKLSRKYTFILTFFIGIYVPIIIIFISRSKNIKDILKFIFGGLAYTAVTAGPNVNCYVQLQMVEVLTIRFRLLQKLLTKQTVCSSKLSATQQVNCLRSLIYFVQEYHNCIRQINEVFSVCLAAVLLRDFTLTTSKFYFYLGSNQLPKDRVVPWFVSVCMIMPLSKMIMAPLYCDKSKHEGEKCFKIIKNAEYWFTRPNDVRPFISSCMLWRIDNKIEFLCGTINYNKQIIVMVYSQIFNYLLILIQFRMTQDMGDEIEKHMIIIQDWIGDDYEYKNPNTSILSRPSTGFEAIEKPPY